eukprot:COSAG06_NODE_38548_length_422_cov_0.910217_1_plen_83_part_10
MGGEAVCRPDPLVLLRPVVNTPATATLSGLASRAAAQRIEKASLAILLCRGVEQRRKESLNVLACRGGRGAAVHPVVDVLPCT